MVVLPTPPFWLDTAMIMLAPAKVAGKLSNKQGSKLES
jgi:hypothetical protein